MAQTNHAIEPDELMAYLDGELSPDRAAAASAHLEKCRECQAIAADLQAVSRQIMVWQVEAPDRPNLESLEARPSGNIKRIRLLWTNLRRLRPWIPGLAVGAFLLAILSFVSPSLYRSQQAIDLVRTRNPVSALNAPSLATDRIALPATRKTLIVHKAQLTLATSEFDKVRDRVEAILKKGQGYIGALYVTAPEGVARTLEATLRVPADQLDATIAELKTLGRVESESQSGEEVTQQYVDLEARLTNAKNAEQRLTALLRQRTGDLADVLAVEKEIDEVREKIERMEAEKKNLGNRVEFGALTLKINEDYKAKLQVGPSSFLARFHNAAVDGYRSMVQGLVDLIAAALTYGPSILLWAGLLFFPTRFAWRKWRG